MTLLNVHHYYLLLQRPETGSTLNTASAKAVSRPWQGVPPGIEVGGLHQTAASSSSSQVDAPVCFLNCLVAEACCEELMLLLPLLLFR
jgi:hypothetical protein